MLSPEDPKQESLEPMWVELLDEETLRTHIAQYWLLPVGSSQLKVTYIFFFFLDTFNV